jgi:ribosomal protein S18 acetylase RimI-like enzyme
MQITQLYHSDPTGHYELAYRILYEPEDTIAVFNIKKGRIVGYCTSFVLCDEPTIEINGEISVDEHLLPLIDRVGLDRFNIIIPEHMADRYVGEIRGSLRVVSESTMNKMVSTRLPAIKTSDYNIIRLDESSIGQFIELKRLGGISCVEEDARRQLSKYLYLGIFLEDKLVSIGAAYVRLPEIWAIGGLYTHPDYRNLGLGTMISAELTKRAWMSGSKAVLKVDEDNLPAIKIFTKTGYKVIGWERNLRIEL